MLPRVAIRVDGDNSMGLGHLTRCIALACMLRNDFRLLFICKALPEKINDEITDLGFGIQKITEEVGFFEAIDSKDIVVLDHYNLDSDFQKRIKDFGCKLVCIDDLHDKPFLADLIINHAPHIFASSYEAKTYTQFALGLEYVLLRPVFLKRSLTQKIISECRIAFVCFGGSDNKNLTKVAVDILVLDKRFDSVNVVVGAAYQYATELKQLIEKDQRFKLYYRIDEEKMADLIAISSIAIVPASGILQEVLALGCKAVSGMYVENQRQIYENYKLMDAFEDAGTFTEEEMKIAIDNLFKNKKIASTHKLIDGKSGIRLLNKFKQLSNENRLAFRLAEAKDVNLTYKWAIDKIIRKYSFSTHKITFEEHSRWFLSKVNNEDNYYFIAILDNDHIGSIRFDIKDNIGIISYLLDPLYHNRGLGIVVLKKGVELLISINNTCINYVVGYVMPENISSIRTFLALGYQMTKEVECFKFTKKIK